MYLNLFILISNSVASNPSLQCHDRIDDIREANGWLLKPESKFWKRCFPGKNRNVLTVGRI
jgi:hypothetical protein